MVYSTVSHRIVLYRIVSYFYAKHFSDVSTDILITRVQLQRVTRGFRSTIRTLTVVTAVRTPEIEEKTVPHSRDP